MAVPQIDITTDLHPKHATIFDTIADLGRRYPPGRCVIVGGLMVMIIAREHGARSARAEGTKDADIAVDLVAKPGLLHEVTAFLESIGYDLLEMGDPAVTARCTYVYHHATIDVLCPDDTPVEQLVVPERNVASIAMPGGRRAFETARPVSVFYADDRPNAEISLPSLAGALAVKAAAATDERTRPSPRHIQDVAFLLTIDVDLDQVSAELISADIERLRQLAVHLDDNRAEAWRYLDADQRQFAQAQFDYLTESRTG